MTESATYFERHQKKKKDLWMDRQINLQIYDKAANIVQRLL